MEQRNIFVSIQLLLSAAGNFFLAHQNGIQALHCIALRFVIVRKLFYIFFYKLRILVRSPAKTNCCGSGLLVDLSARCQSIQIIGVCHIIQIAVIFPFLILVRRLLVVLLLRVRRI